MYHVVLDLRFFLDDVDSSGEAVSLANMLPDHILLHLDAVLLMSALPWWPVCKLTSISTAEIQGHYVLLTKVKGTLCLVATAMWCTRKVATAVASNAHLSFLFWLTDHQQHLLG